MISEIELLCWKTPSEKDLEVLHQFINDALVFELEKDIKIKTAEIRRTHRIKLPDAIIAAMALVSELSLITRNVNDFKAIDDLRLINPHENKSTLPLNTGSNNPKPKASPIFWGMIEFLSNLDLRGSRINVLAKAKDADKLYIAYS